MSEQSKFNDVLLIPLESKMNYTEPLFDDLF